MPSPVPIPQASVQELLVPFDCIQKDDPVNGAFLPTQLDQPAYEALQLQRVDSCQLLSAPFIPYRVFSIADAFSPTGVPEATAEEVWNELNANGNTWWPQVPWGRTLGFGRAGGFGDFQTDPEPPATTSWLVSWFIWENIGNPSFTPPGWAKYGVVTQVLCPAFWIPVNYQIWSVTGRWFLNPFLEAGYADTGNFPVPNPWSMSSDFTQVSNGTLNPGETLVIPPHDLSPQTNCAIPPAPAGIFQSTDGQGWGVANFLVFT